MDKSLPRLRIRVKATAETALRAGHPWLFGDSIQSQNREGRLGELAVVFDRKDRFLAVGLFDPESPIRVRVLHAGKPQVIDRGWWEGRFRAAVKRRQGLFDERTTGFRWINGESDGWPGLVLDRYDRTLVLKLYSAVWLPRLEDLAALIQHQLRPERMVLRLSRNIQSGALRRFSREEGTLLSGSPLSAPVDFLETGLKFEADVLRGQKTGFFLDQRENRRQVKELAQGRRLLNAFSFSGGFSLYAASGAARSVTDLDLSAHALGAGERNFALNRSISSVAACPRESIQAEAFAWLESNPRREFDIVVLDPPSLAKRESERSGAIRAYRRLAGLGLSHLTAGGILLACSCSAHVSAEEFFGSVRSAVAKAARQYEELATAGHAPDHPAGFKEAQYLKAIYFRIISRRPSPGC